MKFLNFEDTLQLTAGEKRHLLLGNGFSRACREDIFAYSSLFDQANFKSLSANAKQAFEVLGTTNFEAVMSALRNASKLVALYEKRNKRLAKRLKQDAEGLRDVLVNAIATNHPERPTDIKPESYLSCGNFLSYFQTFYTLNYDLLLYWTLMHDEIAPKLKADDGFRTPDNGETDYVTWEVEKTNAQNVFYLHGALHIFDTGTEIQKYTWINTGIRLIEQIRDALKHDLYPLIVAEGESKQKLEMIKHNDYLSRGYRSFANIGGTLFIFGHSMGSNDDHVLRLIANGKIKNLYVSLHGDPKKSSNKKIIRKIRELISARPKWRPLEVTYFQAESAKVWD